MTDFYKLKTKIVFLDLIFNISSTVNFFNFIKWIRKRKLQQFFLESVYSLLKDSKQPLNFLFWLKQGSV